jgi:hypothetical protein
MILGAGILFIYLFIYFFGTNGEIHCRKKTINSLSIFFAVMNESHDDASC